jgi:AcrR family transcriptional regulator
MVKAAPPDGRQARVGTRERVLEAALSLFNDRGPDRVTTAEIARAVAINEGNLYYYFRTKEALILALFARFEDDATALVSQAGSAPASDLGTYAGFLRQWFELAWAYRFFFRDLVGLTATAPALTEPIRAVSAHLRVAVEALVDTMARQNLIAVPAADRAALLANVWIVSTYWAVYLNLQEGVQDLTPEHLDWGLNQVASLFRPYLLPDVRAELDRLVGG